VPAFTTRVANLQQQGPWIDLQVTVGAAAEAVLRKAGDPIPAPESAVAMIDTGASHTVIQQDLATRLGLQPVGTTYIHTPSATNVPCPRYRVRLLFPQNTLVEITALAAPLQGQHIQCLIGRDVLARAVFIYIGDNNLFSLSF
jgi:predicted aspartyl protease